MTALQLYAWYLSYEFGNLGNPKIEEISKYVGYCYKTIIGRKYIYRKYKLNGTYNFREIKSMMEIADALYEICKETENKCIRERNWFENMFFKEFPQYKEQYFFWLQIDNAIKVQSFYHSIRRKEKVMQTDGKMKKKK